MYLLSEDPCEPLELRGAELTRITPYPSLGSTVWDIRHSGLPRHQLRQSIHLIRIDLPSDSKNQVP